MQPQLKRTIGFSMLTLYGLGTILGAGIYVLVGKVALFAGLYAPVAFLVAALLAGLTGYSYAAMSSRYPHSAGEAVYIQAAFNQPMLSRLVGWMVVLTGVVSAATVTKGFVGYLQVFVAVPDFWAITLLLILMTTLAIWGVSESVWATAITTLMGIIGLILILLMSLPALMTIPDQLSSLIPPLHVGSAWYGILLGAFLAFYAFIGFEDMVNMAEEVKNPESTLPKAIFAAIMISSVLYVLIALAAVLQLPLEALISSKAPLADIMLQHGQTMAWFISLISLAAVVNGALVQIIMGARVLYGMGNKGLAPTCLARVHAKFRTPYIGTLMIGTVVWLLAIGFRLTTLATVTSFIILVVFLLVNVSLIRVLNHETTTTGMAVKLWVPYLAAFMSAFFLMIQSYQVTFATHAIGH